MNRRALRRKLRAAGRKGGLSKAAKLRYARQPLEPFHGSILDLMDVVGLTDPSWDAWRVFLRAVFGLGLDATQLERYTHHTNRQTAPPDPVRVCYAICGRRSGKTYIAALIAVYQAIRRDYRTLLAPGETALIPIIATDREQAAKPLEYVKGLFGHPALAPYVLRMVRESVETKTAAKIQVKVCSMRTTRGFSMPAVIADELAFWRVEGSAEPDREVINALKPGMLKMPEPLLVGLSTPFAKAGLLYDVYDRWFGKDDVPSTLVWQSPSVEMNPQLDAAVIAQEIEEDPERNTAEYGAVFRTDCAAFLTLEAIERVVNHSRPLELAYREGLRCKAHVDMSGGKQDAATLGVAHLDTIAILDLVREWRAPHSPESVVEEMAALLKSYHIREVRGDHYSAQWVVDAFRRRGIEYHVSKKTKSELYLELVSPLYSGQIEIPNHARLRQQLAGLERWTSRQGKDAVDHRVGGHDDVANAAAGALVQVLGGQGRDGPPPAPIQIPKPPNAFRAGKVDGGGLEVPDHWRGGSDGWGGNSGFPRRNKYDF